MDIGVTQVSCGQKHSCALKAGELYCWGTNGNGELGDGAQVPEGMRTPKLAPVPVTVVSQVQLVSAGQRHTCALVDEDAYCWGDNTYGQLGNGEAGQEFNPTPMRVAGLPRPVTLIHSGTHATCAIAAGDVYCWGRNHEGQLGIGVANDFEAQPQLVALP